MNEEKFPKMLERKVIYESNWISLYTDKVQMPNGNIISTYHNLHYPHETVCCVIFNEKNEILLIQSKRYITNHIEWEVPAGRIENDESAEMAAMRECAEETGCTLKNLTFLCKHNPNNGISDLTVHVFAARVETATMKFDHNEVSTVSWVNIETVLSMLMENQIHCGVSMLAILYAIQFYSKKEHDARSNE